MLTTANSLSEMSVQGARNLTLESLVSARRLKKSFQPPWSVWSRLLKIVLKAELVKINQIQIRILGHRIGLLNYAEPLSSYLLFIPGVDLRTNISMLSKYTRHWINAGITLVDRLRRCTNGKPTFKRILCTWLVAVRVTVKKWLICPDAGPTLLFLYLYLYLYILHSKKTHSGRPITPIFISRLCLYHVCLSISYSHDRPTCFYRINYWCGTQRTTLSLT